MIHWFYSVHSSDNNFRKLLHKVPLLNYGICNIAKYFISIIECAAWIFLNCMLSQNLMLEHTEKK